MVLEGAKLMRETQTAERIEKYRSGLPLRSALDWFLERRRFSYRSTDGRNSSQLEGRWRRVPDSLRGLCVVCGQKSAKCPLPATKGHLRVN